MKRFLKLAPIIVLLFVVSYGLAHAQGTGIWKGTNCAAGSQYGGPVGPCDFCDAIIVADNIINLLFQFSLIIGTLMIVIGGIVTMTAGGSEANAKKGRNIITKAIVGVVIALVSWTVVGTVMQFLSGSANFPWNKISCTHNPELPILSGMPKLQNASTTYAKVDVANGTFACSKSGISCSDAEGTFCANEPCVTIDKSLCGQAAPIDQTQTVWRDTSSGATAGNITTYQCYNTAADCAAKTTSACVQSVTTAGSTYTPPVPPVVTYAKIANDGTIQCSTSSCDAIQGPNIPAYAACITPGNSFYFTDSSQCGQKINITIGGLYAFAKQDATDPGKYICKINDCSIAGTNASDTCFIVQKLQCSGSDGLLY